MTEVDLAAALRKVDPSAAEDLRALARQFGARADFVEALVKAVPEHPIAATWLLKAAKEAGAPPPQDDPWAHAGDFTDWPPKLHLAQIADWAPPPRAAAPLIAAWARDPKPMLRAWALTAARRLADVHPEDEPWAEALISKAATDPAKSVQARLRQMKRGP